MDASSVSETLVTNYQTALHYIPHDCERLKIFPITMYHGSEIRIKLSIRKKQVRQCICNVPLWRGRVIFVPPRLSEQPDTISLEESAFMAI
jgi:hypothetical protein